MKNILYILFLFSFIGSSQYIGNREFLFAATGGIPVVESTSTFATLTDTDTAVLPKPTGTQVGDLLLAFVTNDVNEPVADQYDATSDPTGWTFVECFGNGTTDSSTGMFWKIADAGDVAASNFSFVSVDPNDLSAAMLRISGVHTTPIGANGVLRNVTSITNDMASFNTANNNSLVIGWFTTDGSDTRTFSVSGTGWFEGEELGPTSDAQGNACMWFYKEMATAGATGAVTITTSLSDGTGSKAWEIRSE